VNTEKPLVFFDGVCNYCNYWVNFCIRRDRQKKLLFAPLQGKTANQLLPEYLPGPAVMESVILVDKGKLYTKSAAVLRLARYLDGGWKLAYGLIIIPGFIRDFVYNIIARNRYRWFGKRDECMVPTPAYKERFLE